MSAADKDATEPRGSDPKTFEDPSQPDTDDETKWKGVELADEVGPDQDEDDDEDDLNQEFIEELLRLRLSPANSSTSNGASSASGTGTGHSLPPGQRIQLYQPRTKLEQFEDILMESQLLGGSPLSQDSLMDAGVSEALSELDSYGMMDNYFDASEVIFGDKAISGDTEDKSLSKSNSDDGNNDLCQCSSCQERLNIESQHLEQLEMLRQCWAELREDVATVYRKVLDGSWVSDPSCKDRVDLNKTKDSVRRLCYRDPHQLFVRLEAAVKEFVLEIKLKLIELIHQQAKNPSLAEDFIKDLLSGHDKLCIAAQNVSPALVDLEGEHLKKFQVTWETLNKHLYQSIIYTDPLIQKNIPIFISQLRSLYTDKESEKKYTDLVRKYLDFDVEMNQVGEVWKTSEVIFQDYNMQQNRLKARQDMLKKDWEKFKAQRRKLEKQMMVTAGEDDRPHRETSDSCGEGSSDVTLKNVEESLEASTSTDNKECLNHCTSLHSATTCNSSMENSSSSSAMNTFAKLYPHLYSTFQEDAKKLGIDDLSSIFPGSAEGLKSKLKKLNSEGVDSGKIAAELSDALSAALSLTVSNEHEKVLKNSTTTAVHQQSSGEINKEASSEESKSKTKEIAASNSCTSKVTSSSTITKTSTKVGSGCKGNHHHGLASHNSKDLNKLLQQHRCNYKKHSAKAVKRGKVPPSPLHNEGSSNIESATDDDDVDDDDYDDESFPDDCSSSSASTSNTNDSKNCSCCYCEVFGHGGQSAAPVSRNYPEMRERLRLLLSKKKKEKCSQNAKSTPAGQSNMNKPVQNVPNTNSVNAKPKVQSAMLTSTTTANVSKDRTRAITPQSVVARVPDAVETKDVDELLDFIEGNQKCTNEKKKAKKERQKQQKIEELKKREEEERKRKEAIEAERKRRELEVKKQQEAERLMMKKQKKKAAQKAKKAAAKGISITELDNQQQRSSMSSMDQLKMQKIQEIQRIKMMHQQEVEEQERKLQQLLHEHGGGQADMKLANSNGMHFKPSFPPAAAPSSKGPQVKITRTPDGGAQFTQVSASEVTEQAFRPTRTPFAPMPAAQPTVQPTAPGLSFITNGQPAIPSSAKTNSNTPMVTIRRVQGGDRDGPTVTISSKDSKNKLLYTLVNGQIHMSKHAPENLIPNAKPGIPALEAKLGDGKLSKNQKKKLKKLSRSGSNEETPTTYQSTVAPPSPAMMSQPVRNPGKLPTTKDGKVDLDRLQLPSGISITRIEGPVPERKYFPMPNPSPPEVQSSFRTNNTLGSMNGESKSGELLGGYQTTPSVGYPSIKDLDVNGSNVIVVDASSLASNDEAETSKKGKKKTKNNKNKKSPQSDGIDANRQQLPFTNSSHMSGSQQELLFKPEIPVQEQSKSNSMKSGPQILIKNINGKVVMTPVPGTGATLPNPSATDQPNNIVNGESPYTNGFVSDVNEVTFGDGKNKKRKNSSKNNSDDSSADHHIDDINSIFDPKDIDLENGDIDDDEREIEAFKRFCINSVNLLQKQKPKINIDLDSITPKKK